MINHNVFQDVEGLMSNVEKVTNKLSELKELKSLDKMQVIKIKSNVDGKNFVEFDNQYFRIYEFMKDAETYDSCEDERIIKDAGNAFGLFIKLLNVGEKLDLCDTIPNFHNTEQRIKNLLNSHKNASLSRKEKSKNTFNVFLIFSTL